MYYDVICKCLQWQNDAILHILHYYLKCKGGGGGEKRSSCIKYWGVGGESFSHITVSRKSAKEIFTYDTIIFGMVIQMW